jgi:hypothetical protein
MLDTRQVAAGFHFGTAQLESDCGEDYHPSQSGHRLSDRDGAHVRVDGLVDLAWAVCRRARSFGGQDVSTVRRRMSRA